jgi:hypothetical protein
MLSRRIDPKADPAICEQLIRFFAANQVSAA